jgi:hypothetical protein
MGGPAQDMGCRNWKHGGNQRQGDRIAYEGSKAGTVVWVYAATGTA